MKIIPIKRIEIYPQFQKRTRQQMQQYFSKRKFHKKKKNLRKSAKKLSIFGESIKKRMQAVFKNHKKLYYVRNHKNLQRRYKK